MFKADVRITFLVEPLNLVLFSCMSAITPVAHRPPAAFFTSSLAERLAKATEREAVINRISMNTTRNN